MPPAQVYAKVAKATINTHQKIDRPVTMWSGIAVAKTRTLSPRALIDMNIAEAVFRVFEKLVDEGKTILMVTHDMDLASRVTRTVGLADGEITADQALHWSQRGVKNG